MNGHRIKDGFIDMAVTQFHCPDCNKEYNDDKDKYLKRMNYNNDNIVTINCKCGSKFSITYNIMSEIVVFKPVTNNMDKVYFDKPQLIKQGGDVILRIGSTNKTNMTGIYVSDLPQIKIHPKCSLCGLELRQDENGDYPGCEQCEESDL